MIKREIHKIDATDKILGRLASQIARILMGKNKVEYRHDQDFGDFVEVSNIGKIKVTGHKAEVMAYYQYSGFPGGMRKTDYKEKLAKKPEDILKEAVYYMLPKNKLSNGMMKRLKFVN